MNQYKTMSFGMNLLLRKFNTEQNKDVNYLDYTIIQSNTNHNSVQLFYVVFNQSLSTYF